MLVVEDDSAINDVICRQLSRLGVVPEPTFSGTEANRALDSEDFDLVVTDLMLPGMAGEQVIELIRNRDALVPIVVVSARTETRDKVDILGLGADDYLTKPFDLDELSARIQAQLRRSLALRLIKDDPDNENQPATLANRHSEYQCRSKNSRDRGYGNPSDSHRVRTSRTACKISQTGFHKAKAL